MDTVKHGDVFVLVVVIGGVKAVELELDLTQRKMYLLPPCGKPMLK